MWKTARITLLSMLMLLAPTALAAQGAPLASQTLGRGYWHVFIAYAIAWILIGGWLFSVVRRLARLERRFGPDES